MSIGAGIAVAGAWMFAAACAYSSSVSGGGLLLSILVAIGVTAAVLAV